MYADHAIDYEFQPRQTDTVVWNIGKIECAIRIADVHHDLYGNLG